MGWKQLPCDGCGEPTGGMLNVEPPTPLCEACFMRALGRACAAARERRRPRAGSDELPGPDIGGEG